METYTSGNSSRKESIDCCRVGWCTLGSHIAIARGYSFTDWLDMVSDGFHETFEDSKIHLLPKHGPVGELVFLVLELRWFMQIKYVE